MTPAARVAAAIEILDAVLDGAPAERTLTRWARGSRYAGSKDRAAIRDHVFDAMRRLASAAAEGGGRTGRGVMIGLLRQAGVDPSGIFTGEGHAPAPLAPGEGVPMSATRAERLDMQDWVLPHLDASLGGDAGTIAELLRHRAPVFARANLKRTTPSALIERLAAEGVTAAPHPLATTALEIKDGARRLTRTRAFSEGLFELQDAASQAVVEDNAGVLKGARVLDYCAGGGGKALAIAALGADEVVAHDIDAGRMSDIPARAKRAGAAITVTDKLASSDRFDVVFCDAPCSGSGAWRRQPEAKWRLTPARLKDLTVLQQQILRSAQNHVRPEGALIYATCSLFAVENAEAVDAFLETHTGWSEEFRRSRTPLDGGDGFFVARLRRPPAEI